jgi:hypothetical protein
METMNESREARELARQLDTLLQGQPDMDPGAASAEIEALSKLGNSLARIQFTPRPAHQAAFERLLRQHPPILPSRNFTMPFSVQSTPLSLLLVILTLILGALSFKASQSRSPVPVVETPDRAAAPVQTDTRPPIMLVPATGGQSPAASETVSLTVTATPTAAHTLTPTVVGTPTATSPSTTIVPPAVISTPTVAVTLTIVGPPRAVSRPRAAMTPTATPTPTLAGGRAGLAFHPEHLNVGGVCQTTYSASGSLKNHGPDTATNVDIHYTIVDGAQWVDSVEVSPSSWAELETSKPGRFTVSVHTNGDWPLAGKGAEIVVRLGAPEGAQATFTITNQCQVERPNKPDKPDKPNQKDEPDKKDKPQKQ